MAVNDTFLEEIKAGNSRNEEVGADGEIVEVVEDGVVGGEGIEPDRESNANNEEKE